MNDVDVYVQAATCTNTRRSYASALRHFEVEWGGFLPASADSVARYLAAHAAILTLNTLRQRLAALSRWHQDHGFTDPTKQVLVRTTLKGISALHPATETRAVPLQINDLTQAVTALDCNFASAIDSGNWATQLRSRRDKALLLLGFWRGFRSDELIRLHVEHVSSVPGQGMQCFLQRSKTDRQSSGRSFNVPALSRLCPVAAYTDWIELASLDAGPVFRGIDRWGRVRETGLHANSIIPLLRSTFTNAGLPTPDQYSSHSLRRGFASWANANNWDLKGLMEYVGWRDVKSAMRYIDGADSFGQERIERGLAREVLACD